MFKYFYAITIIFLSACNTSTKPNTSQVLFSRARISAALSTYDTCGALESDIKEHFKAESTARLEILRNQQNIIALSAKESDASAGGAPPSPSANSRTEGVDYSGTNNQEKNVDESDFVKTDGNFIYIINGNMLEILGVPNFGELNYLNNLTIEGMPSQILQFDDRVVVFSYFYDAQNQGRDMKISSMPGFISISRSKLTVVKLNRNIQDHTVNPSVEKEFYIDGSFMTARKIASKIFAVTYFSPSLPNLMYWPQINVPDDFNWNDAEASKAAWNQAVDAAIANNIKVIDDASLDSLVPHFYSKDANNRLQPQALTSGDCANFSAAEDSVARGFASVVALDLNQPDLATSAEHILSNQPQVYASATQLVLAEPTEDAWWFYANIDVNEATNLHRFTILNDGATTYTGSGRIDGSILNQFSLSEYNGYVRAVSTTGRFARWFVPENERTQSENHLYILSGDDELNVVGSLHGIARGERIWSARFIENKGYLVTFKNIDPLFTIDLTNPTQPTIVAELKVPGVSTYIHPLGSHLLNVGYGGTNDGLDWTTNVSLFDVSDFSNPSQESVLSFAPTAGNQNDGWSGAWSEANYEHKAITYWEPKRLLAIPISAYRSTPTSWEYASSLKLVHAEPGFPLEVKGEVSHSKFYSNKDTYVSPDIRRSIFMGSYIYAISAGGITATSLDDFKESAAAELKGEPYFYPLVLEETDTN